MSYLLEPNLIITTSNSIRQDPSTKIHQTNSSSLLVFTLVSLVSLVLKFQHLAMCVVDRITYSCTHIENVYVNRCGAPGKRCAKQISPRTSDSVCPNCLQKYSPLERHRAIVELYDDLKEYLAQSFELTDTFDHDILVPQVQRILDVIEEQKSNALVELELKIAIEIAKKNEVEEGIAQGSQGGWI